MGTSHVTDIRLVQRGGQGLQVRGVSAYLTYKLWKALAICVVIFLVSFWIGFTGRR